MSRRAQSGFTLMEVVVATALMAMLMGILFIGLRVGANAWHRGQQKLDERAAVAASYDLLERQITAATPRILSETRDQQTVRYVGFRGGATEAKFLTTSSWESDHAHPLFAADYQVKTLKDGGEQLVISERGITAAGSMVQALTADPLLAPLSNIPARELTVGDPANKIEFAYLQPAVGQTPALWVSDWISEQHSDMPRGIRIFWTRGNQVEAATFALPITRELGLQP